MKRIVMVMLAVALNACSKEEKIQPANDQVRYGLSERNVIDFHYVGPTCFLFIHGGGWIMGDKSSFAFLDAAVEKHGFSYASMNYRYANENVHWREMQQDVDKAVKLLKERGIREIILVGRSAGANIAMLYASQNNVSLVVGIGNPVRVDTLVAEHVKQLGAIYAPNPEEVNILYHLPRCYTILINGAQDYVTYAQQSVMLKKRLGANARMILLEGKGHYIEEGVLQFYMEEICRMYPQLPHPENGVHQSL